MLASESSAPAHPHNPQSTTKIGGVLLAIALAALAVLMFATPAHASLPLGSVQSQTSLSSCPGDGWFSYTSGGTTYPMNCVAAILQCNNIENPSQNLGFTYGYLSPSVIGVSPVNGVVVYLNGGNGTGAAGGATGSPSGEVEMVQYAFEQGYEVVQIAWNSAWEATYNPFPPNTYGNIQNAACRPATFLSYVATAPASWNLYQSVVHGNSSAGMCAQGDSAGSAAVAYSLAYYGAGSFLDNVELISGPVLSDIKQGCQEPPPVNPTTICPGGQWGCQLGSSGASWSLYPTYLSGANMGVGNWTNDHSCGVPNSNNSMSWPRWLAQSIVDDGTNSPTFNYPHTAMAGWLCRTVYDPINISCQSNFDPRYCPNNSSPQGEIFYAQITSSNSPPVYNLYAVDRCDGPEGAPSTASSVSGYLPSVFTTGISGFNAITFDMAGYPPKNIPAQCIRRLH